MKLFDCVELNHLTVKNRLWRSATWESLASPEGFLNDEIYEIYGQLAKGGVGVIVTGLTDVSPYDWSLVGNMRLCSDSLIEDYRRLTEIVHQEDTRILAQINMNYYQRPERRICQVEIDEMTHDDIADAVSLYIKAAGRAAQAGFDGVQLHLAYGWFLNRFLNPLENHREDAYGGNTEYRIRIVSDIIQGIRKLCPQLHISAKFSFFNRENGEVDLEECLTVCRALSACGLDSLEVLGGHSSKERGTKYFSCYCDLAEAVRRVTDIPLILTGNNHDPALLRQLLDKNVCDFFAMSRPLIREPDLPGRWERGDLCVSQCISCGQCYKTHGKRCIFNIKKNEG